jgi:hypothetical protein
VQYDHFYGDPRVTVFDPLTNKFNQLHSMAHGRWYATANDPDGSVSAYSWYFPSATPTTSTVLNPGVVTFPNLGNFDRVVDRTPSKTGRGYALPSIRKWPKWCHRLRVTRHSLSGTGGFCLIQSACLSSQRL